MQNFFNSKRAGKSREEQDEIKIEGNKIALELHDFQVRVKSENNGNLPEGWKEF